MRVPVPGRRSTTEETPSGLVIVIPAKRHIFAVIFLLAWLAGWAMGEFFAAREVLTGETGFANLFLVAWLVMWTLGGAWAAYSALWLAVGKEIVSLRPGTLTLKRDVLGLGRLHEYDVQHVRNLRASAHSNDPFQRGAGFGPWGTSAGTVAFDYGSKTIRFGAVEEAEAQQIIADMKARHSFAEGAA